MRQLLMGLLAVLLTTPSVALAVAVNSVSVSGPGGSGSGTPLTNYARAQLTYTSSDYLDIAITVDGPGNYNLYEAVPDGSLTNNSGQSWTSIQFINMTPDVGLFFNFWYDSGSVFSQKVISDDLVILYSGLLPSGSSASAPIGAYTYYGEGPGTFIIRQVPVAIPEPSSVILAGVGFVGALVLAWRRRR